MHSTLVLLSGSMPAALLAARVVGCPAAASGRLTRKAATRLAFTAAALLAAASTARAQMPAPRNGNVWDFKAHQPTEGEVIRREDRAGVELPPGQSKQDTRSVETLERQLLHREAVDPPRSSAPNPAVQGHP